MSFKTSLFKNTFYLTLIIVVLFQVLLAFQGFDVCDDGFVLTFYQQIFSHPESVEYNFLYWFSGIVGGLWHQVYEDGGILWFRMLAVFVNTSTFFVAYKLLRPYINEKFLLLALVMIIFVNDYGYLTFYHNHLTALMTVLIVSVLHKAAVKDSLLLYAFSGLLLSINVFTRIPNLVLFSFVLVIPYAYYLRKESLIKSIKPILLFAIGSLLGFLTVYIVMLFLDQIEIMKRALFTIEDLGNTENSSHNFKSVFKAPFYNYKSIAIETFRLITILISIYVVKRVLSNGRMVGILIFALTTLLFMYWFTSHNIYPIYCLCLIGSIAVILLKRVEKEVKYLGLLSLLTLVTITLGTGGGIQNSGYMAIWIGLPLFFYVVNNFNIFFKDSKLLKTSLIANPSEACTHSFLTAVIIAFLVLKAYNISQQSYFDYGSRYEKTYAINSTLAKGIYTTKKRADIVNELLFNLDKFIEPDDYLMAYDKIPMVHFLTETKPYMYNPWVWIYDYNSFEKKLHKAEVEIEELPIVVQQKFETIHSFSEPIFDYMSTGKTNNNSHSNERNAIMNSFLERNNYKVVWSNSYFNIYKPKKRVEEVH